jgi:hypothetical protein
MIFPSKWYTIKSGQNISGWNMNKGKNVNRVPLPKIKLKAGIHGIIAEVASTNSTRVYGLMYRK